MRLAAIALTLVTGCATVQKLQTAPPDERNTVYAVIGLMIACTVIGVAIAGDDKTEMPLHPRL